MPRTTMSLLLSCDVVKKVFGKWLKCSFTTTPTSITILRIPTVSQLTASEECANEVILFFIN